VFLASIQGDRNTWFPTATIAGRNDPNAPTELVLQYRDRHTNEYVFLIRLQTIDDLGTWRARTSMLDVGAELKVVTSWLELLKEVADH